MARYVSWRTPDEPVAAPIAVVTDAPGGPLDRLVADSDVTTFLNDRFHPVLTPRHADQPPGTLAVYDGDGCLLAGPIRPLDAAAIIALGNEVMRDPRSRGVTAPRLPTECARR